MKTNLFKRILKHFGITLVIVSLLYSNTNTYLIFTPKIQTASAATWYNTSWLYRIKITVNHTKVAANLTDFPVYVDLANMPVAFFTHVKAGGADIRITTSDEVTEVPVEIVDIDTGAKTGELHFKAPSLSSSIDTDFYIYYGNASASAYSVTATYGRNNVWANYTRVGHGNESSIVDATGNGGNGSTIYPPSIINGKVGKALSFNGSNQYIKIPFSAPISLNNRTISSWINVQGLGPGSYGLQGGVVIGGAINGNSNPQISISATNAGYIISRGFAASSTNLSRTYGLDTTGTWVYATATISFNPTTKTVISSLYINGDLYGTPFEKTGIDKYEFMSDGIQLGVEKPSAGVGARYFNGYIDEYRISENTLLSPNWIKTEYNNQSSPSTFYNINTEEIYNSNTAPTITSSSDSPDPVDAGQNITFSVGFTDADGDGVKTYICKTASFTAGVGCNGGTWAKQDSSFSTTTPQNMTYTTTLSDVAINNYYPFIEDSNGASASGTASTFTVTTPTGTLSVDIVDSGGSSVTSPSITLSPIDFSFSEQTSNGTFGTSDEKIHIDNNTSTATWSVSIAPNDGSTALWQGASNQYDFNDTSLSANDDDSDADSVGGKMTIDPTVSTITPASGCGLTNISTGGNASFAEGSTDSITLASATTGANTTCSWDITGIGISQTIPAEQPADSYSIDMTLSIIAS